MTDLQRLYALRFEETGLKKRQRVWQVLCREFFDALIEPRSTVLDLACGYGEFINAVACGRKLAADINPDAAAHLAAGIAFYQTKASDLGEIAEESVDAVFASNILEHLASKEECSKAFAAVWRILARNGTFILLGPNIKYAYREYWDVYDHVLPLSDVSVSEGLRQQGFTIERVIPRFLPFTMNNSLPSFNILIRIYLRFPPAWRLFGKQFLVVARKSKV